MPDRDRTGDGYTGEGRTLPSDDYILRDAHGRAIAVCTSYCGEVDVDPRYSVETTEDVQVLVDPDGASTHPDGAVGELRDTIEAAVRQRYPLVANLPAQALSKIVQFAIWPPQAAVESEFELGEEELLEAVLSKAMRIDKVFNLEHGTTNARIAERFRKRPASMGIGELVRVLRWIDEEFGDVV